MIKYIKAVSILLTHTDGSAEFMTLEAPNASDPFDFRPMRIPNRGKFRDKNNILRRKNDIYTIRWTYRYNHHDMDLRPLLRAKYIDLPVPPDFTGSYTGHRVRLVNDEIVRNWLEGIPSNHMPGGPIELQFERIEPLTWEDLLSTKWFEPAT